MTSIDSLQLTTRRIDRQVGIPERNSQRSTAPIPATSVSGSRPRGSEAFLQGQRRRSRERHVRKRGNKWAVVYDEGRDESGRRIQRWRSGFKTRREAERELTEVLSRLEHGIYAQPSSKTLADFLEEWLQAVRGQLRPTTWSSYKMLVDKHIVPRIGSTPLQKLTALQLNAMYADMLERGRRNGKGGLSVRTCGIRTP